MHEVKASAAGYVNFLREMRLNPQGKTPNFNGSKGEK